MFDASFPRVSDEAAQRESLAKVGQLLVERNALSPEALARALETVDESETAFLDRLVFGGSALESDVVAFLAERSGFPGIDLSRSAFLLSVLELVPRAIAEQEQLLPLSTEGGRLHIAVVNPAAGKESFDEVRFITGLDTSLYIALPGALSRCIRAAFDAHEKGEAVWRGSAVSPDAPPKLASLQPLPVGPVSQQADASAPQPGPRAEPDDELLELSPDDEIIEGELIPEDPAAPAPEPTATPIESARVLPAVATPPANPKAKKPPSIEIQIAPSDDDAGDEEELVVSVHTGPKRILVVDDEPDIIRLCTRALQIKGYLVESAADGALAEARLKRSPAPDLVLLDAMLPLVHGFEICQRIKSNKALREVPVIMMSAVYRGWRFAQDAKESYGADDFIEKPFHIGDLLRRVDERLAGGKPGPQQQKGSTERLYREGVELLAAGKAALGRKALEAAAREDPFSPRVQFALGGALAAVGDTYRAITAYERAVELRPKLFPALKALAALYLEKGFRQKAAETLERAFANAPDPKEREEIRAQLARLA